MADCGKQGNKVLIAMDGSKHSIYAFEWYMENVYDECDTIIIAHCAEMGVSLPSTAYMGNPSTVGVMIKAHDSEVKRVMGIIEEVVSKHNIKHTLERIHEPAGESIVKAANEHGVDFIVVGSRGLGTIRRTILGSVSDYIVHHAHVPVFICKHKDGAPHIK